MSADDDIPEEQAKVVDRLLLESAEAANYERINLCLEKGADIDARNANGRTPLMIAVWNERTELVQFLLGKAPALFLRDNSGKSAFDLIADVRDGGRREAITDLLLRALPDHARRAGTPVEAAALAEAEAKEAPVATGSDITVSKPLVLPRRTDPKGFRL